MKLKLLLLITCACTLSPVTDHGGPEASGSTDTPHTIHNLLGITDIASIIHRFLVVDAVTSKDPAAKAREYVRLLPTSVSMLYEVRKVSCSLNPGFAIPPLHQQLDAAVQILDEATKGVCSAALQDRVPRWDNLCHSIEEITDRVDRLQKLEDVAKDFESLSDAHALIARLGGQQDTTQGAIQNLDVRKRVLYGAKYARINADNYEAVVLLSERLAVIHKRLSEMYKDVGNTPKSRAELSSIALELRGIAALRISTNNHGAAASAFERAAAMYESLSAMFKDEGDPEEARTHLGDAVRAFRDAAREYSIIDKHKAAASALERAAALEGQESLGC